MIIVSAEVEDVLEYIGLRIVRVQVLAKIKERINNLLHRNDSHIASREWLLLLLLLLLVHLWSLKLG